MDHRIVQIAKGLPDSADFVEQELSDLASMYVQDSSHFVARLMAPSVRVPQQGGKFYEYSKADFNRDEMQLRGDATQAAVGGYRRRLKEFFCNVFALAKDVGPQELKNNPRAPRNAARYLARKDLIKGEKMFASVAWKTGVWATEHLGSQTPTGTEFQNWLDADADPIAQLEQCLEEAEEKSAGFPINVIGFGRRAWRVFKNHPNVIGRFNNGQTSGGAVVTEAAVAALLGVEKVVVAKAVETTSLPGVAEDSSTFDRILDEDGVLGVHVAKEASMEEPSALYHFDWDGFAQSTENGVVIFEDDIPLTRGAKRYEIEHGFESKLIASAMGFWLENIVDGVA